MVSRHTWDTQHTAPARAAARAAVALALACALAAGCSGGQDVEADLAAIEQTNALTLQALNEGNLELLNEMTAKNHIMMIPGRPELRGRNAILAANANLISSWNIVERWMPIETVVSGDYAWQRGEFDINMTPKRDGVDPIVSVGKYLHIYERQDDGSWLMIRDMFSDNGGSE
jgi:ketosteroid isomerase-like protein